MSDVCIQQLKSGFYFVTYLTVIEQLFSCGLHKKLRLCSKPVSCYWFYSVYWSPFHITAPLRAFLLCFQPCAACGYWELNSSSGEVQAKLLIFTSSTGLAVKIIELLRTCFNQDWEFMPSASVGAGTCQESRVHWIHQISSMHGAKGLQRQQHGVLCVAQAANNQTCPHWPHKPCEVLSVRKCPLTVCGVRLQGQQPWAAELGLGWLAWLCAPDQQEAVAQNQMKSRNKVLRFYESLSFLLTLCCLSVPEGSCNVAWWMLHPIHHSFPNRYQATIFVIVGELIIMVWGFLQHFHFTSEYVKYIQTLPFKVMDHPVLGCAIWIGWNTLQLLLYTAAEYLWSGYQWKHILFFRLAFCGFHKTFN